MVAPAQQPNMWASDMPVVQRGDVWALGQHRLMCGDATNGVEVERLLDGATPDLIFADPPYGIGIDAWDIPIKDVSAFFALITANLKQGGFFAFTHQMPYMVKWLCALEETDLKYKDHVAWVKRLATTPGAALMRSHENLFIYRHGKAQYHQTEGRYEDVKVPGVMFDVVAIDGIQVHISDLRLKLKGDSHRIMKHHPVSYRGYNGTPSTSDRSPEHVNFTNVWSFLPEYRHHLNHAQQERHATAKPLLLMQRLIELCTPEQATVYDPFLGSGTTLLAAQATGRICFGMELSPEYCAAIITRWQSATGQQAALAQLHATTPPGVMWQFKKAGEK